MPIPYKQFFPAENIDSMRKLVDDVELLGKQLKPVLDECLAKHSRHRVQESFQNLSFLVTMCVTASQIFESHLNVVLTFEAPGHMKIANSLRNQNISGPTNETTRLAEVRSDKHFEGTGFRTHEAASLARNDTASRAKEREQLKIGLEVLKIAASIARHDPVALFETGLAVLDFLDSSRGKQLAHEFERLAVGLEALETLEKQLEDMCLFLYLIPQISDLEAKIGVDEPVARVRLKEALPKLGKL